MISNEFCKAIPKISKLRLNESETHRIESVEAFESLCDDCYRLLLDRIVISQLPDDCVNVDQCIFRNCDLSRSTLHFCNFTDCIFENCNLSNCNWGKVGLHRVKFIECKLTGSNLTEGYIGDTEWRGCVGEGFGLVLNKLRDVHLADCDFQQFAIYSCDVLRLQFTHCKLKRWETQETAFRGLDLAGNDIEGARFDPKLFYGCRLSLEQASMLARMLGFWIE